MATDTTYKTWLDAREAVARQGDIEEFILWMVENPSPLHRAGIFSEEPPTRKQLVHRAFHDAAMRFAGSLVVIEATDEPEASSRWVWKIEGVLRGVGNLCGEGNGAPDIEIITVENEHGNFQAVRISRIMSMEKGR